MAQYLIQDTTLTNIADGIRGINDSIDNYKPAQMVTELNAMANEVNTQTDLIADILEAVNNLPEANAATANVVSGTITSDEQGTITFPMPAFEPKQIMVWNVREIYLDDYTGHNGVMLCAVKLETGHWIAHYMASQSGVYYIAQASAERGPFQNDIAGYSQTNIYETNDSLVWSLGESSDDYGVTDFTNVTLNYVLVG